MVDDFDHSSMAPHVELSMCENSGVFPTKEETSVLAVVDDACASSFEGCPTRPLSRRDKAVYWLFGQPLSDGVALMLISTAWTIAIVLLTLFALYAIDVGSAAGMRQNVFLAISGMIFACFLIFVLEIILCSVFVEGYFLSFFFFVDVIGTASLVFDIQWLAATVLSNKDSNTIQITRAGRAARLGSQLGRIARIVRVLRMFRFVRLVKAWQLFQYKRRLRNGTADPNEPFPAGRPKTALRPTVLGELLAEATTRKCVIIIICTLVVSTFLMPIIPQLDDFGNVELVAFNVMTAQTFAAQSPYPVADMTVVDPYNYTMASYTFIDTHNYRPTQLQTVQVECVTFTGPGGAPVACSTPTLYSAVTYDVTTADQINGGFNIALTTAILICLCVSAYLFSRDATKYIIKPIEMLLKLLAGVTPKGALDEPDGYLGSSRRRLLSNVDKPETDMLARHVMRLVNEIDANRKRAEDERTISDILLNSMVPPHIAAQLKALRWWEVVEDQSIADSYADVTVVFTDIVGFTSLSSRISPEEAMRHLNYMYSLFDRIVEKYGLYKVETVGDSYMAVSGAPYENHAHAECAALAALDMRDCVPLLQEMCGEKDIDIRIGMHSGPVTAGVVGFKNPRWHLFGDTCNTASRMESTGIAGEVQLSQQTHDRIANAFYCKIRGKIAVKGKGEMVTYLLVRPKGDFESMSQGLSPHGDCDADPEAEQLTLAQQRAMLMGSPQFKKALERLAAARNSLVMEEEQIAAMLSTVDDATGSGGGGSALPTTPAVLMVPGIAAKMGTLEFRKLLMGSDVSGGDDGGGGGAAALAASEAVGGAASGQSLALASAVCGEQQQDASGITMGSLKLLAAHLHEELVSYKRIVGEHDSSRATLRRMEMLVKLNRRVVFAPRPLPLRDLLSGVLDVLYGSVECDVIRVFLADHMRQQLWPAARTITFSSSRPVPMEGTLVGWCCTERTVLCVDDVARDQRFNHDMEEVLGYSSKSMLAIPVFGSDCDSRSDVIAVVVAVNRWTGWDQASSDVERRIVPFTEGDVSALQDACEGAGVLLAHRRHEILMAITAPGTPLALSMPPAVVFDRLHATPRRPPADLCQPRRPFLAMKDDEILGYARDFVLAMCGGTGSTSNTSADLLPASSPQLVPTYRRSTSAAHAERASYRRGNSPLISSPTLVGSGGRTSARDNMGSGAGASSGGYFSSSLPRNFTVVAAPPASSAAQASLEDELSLSRFAKFGAGGLTRPSSSSLLLSAGTSGTPSRQSSTSVSAVTGGGGMAAAAAEAAAAVAGVVGVCEEALVVLLVRLASAQPAGHYFNLAHSVGLLQGIYATHAKCDLVPLLGHRNLLALTLAALTFNMGRNGPSNLRRNSSAMNNSHHSQCSDGSPNPLSSTMQSLTPSQKSRASTFPRKAHLRAMLPNVLPAYVDSAGSTSGGTLLQPASPKYGSAATAHAIAETHDWDAPSYVVDGRATTGRTGGATSTVAFHRTSSCVRAHEREDEQSTSAARIDTLHFDDSNDGGVGGGGGNYGGGVADGGGRATAVPTPRASVMSSQLEALLEGEANILSHLSESDAAAVRDMTCELLKARSLSNVLAEHPVLQPLLVEAPHDAAALIQRALDADRHAASCNGTARPQEAALESDGGDVYLAQQTRPLVRHSEGHLGAAPAAAAAAAAARAGSAALGGRKTHLCQQYIMWCLLQAWCEQLHVGDYNHALQLIAARGADMAASKAPTTAAGAAAEVPQRSSALTPDTNSEGVALVLLHEVSRMQVEVQPVWARLTELFPQQLPLLDAMAANKARYMKVIQDMEERACKPPPAPLRQAPPRSFAFRTSRTRKQDAGGTDHTADAIDRPTTSSDGSERPSNQRPSFQGDTPPHSSNNSRRGVPGGGGRTSGNGSSGGGASSSHLQQQQQQQAVLAALQLPRPARAARSGMLQFLSSRRRSSCTDYMAAAARPDGASTTAPVTPWASAAIGGGAAAASAPGHGLAHFMRRTLLRNASSLREARGPGSGGTSGTGNGVDAEMAGGALAGGTPSPPSFQLGTGSMTRAAASLNGVATPAAMSHMRSMNRSGRNGAALKVSVTFAGADSEASPSSLGRTGSGSGFLGLSPSARGVCASPKVPSPLRHNSISGLPNNLSLVATSRSADKAGAAGETTSDTSKRLLGVGDSGGGGTVGGTAGGPFGGTEDGGRSSSSRRRRASLEGHVGSSHVNRSSQSASPNSPNSDPHALFSMNSRVSLLRGDVEQLGICASNSSLLRDDSNGSGIALLSPQEAASVGYKGGAGREGGPLVGRGGVAGVGGTRLQETVSWPMRHQR